MIRVAVAVAAADAPPNAFVVWRGIGESIAKAAQYSYDGVELALRAADEIDIQSVRTLLAHRSLGCPAITTGQVFAGSGLYMTAPDASTRDRTMDVLSGLVDAASDLGSMLNLGRARGFVEEGETYREAEARFVSAARELTAYAHSRGVTVILEPINRYESNFINSIQQGVDLIEKVGAPNLALMPDLFHMNIEDPTLDGELERCAPHIAYLHIADSNRLAPGRGHTDFEAVFAALKRAGYDGWVSVEILPFPDPDSAAREAIGFLAPFRERYNCA